MAGELVALLVLVVVAVLVVRVILLGGGVQHVDCVTFCTSSFLIKGVEKERKREREGKRKRKRKRKRRLLLQKGFSFFFGCFLAPGSPPEKFNVIPSPENKPTKANWALSCSSALDFVEKLFVNQGLISDLILFGQADMTRFFQRMFKTVPQKHMFFDKKWSAIFLPQLRNFQSNHGF